MKRNRVVAALLALFLGRWGVHKFYLGKHNEGIVYVCLSFLFISIILGFIDFLILISMSDQVFDQKYNEPILPESGRSYTFNPPYNTSSPQDKIKSLAGLKELYDQGIITAEEYEEKRRHFLDDLTYKPTTKPINQKSQKVDLNSCSKNDIVHKLGLPIVYANDIEALRNEGFIFTDLHELEDLIGIPEYYLDKIKNQVVFLYDYRKEPDHSWRKLNTLSVEELMTYNLSLDHAQIIVKERNKRGKYNSLLDVKNRTGIPLEFYRHLV